MQSQHRWVWFLRYHGGRRLRSGPLSRRGASGVCAGGAW
nr:MAG TPA: hypothetical protein [Caudoviricetes sp.]